MSLKPSSAPGLQSPSEHPWQLILCLHTLSDGELTHCFPALAMVYIDEHALCQPQC